MKKKNNCRKKKTHILKNYDFNAKIKKKKNSEF